MGLYFDFPPGWWMVILFIYGLFIYLFLQRRSYQRKGEIKAQMVFALVIMVISFIIEIIAINLKVWTYFPGNWPVILWLGYFGSGLLGYQLVKKIEEIIK